MGGHKSKNPQQTNSPSDETQAHTFDKNPLEFNGLDFHLYKSLTKKE